MLESWHVHHMDAGDTLGRSRALWELHTLTNCQHCVAISLLLQCTQEHLLEALLCWNQYYASFCVLPLAH